MAMEFLHTKLDNGLTIIAESNSSSASMAAGFFVRTGSRDESKELSGVSHFLEHMVFKGTDRRTAIDVNLEFDRMGAEYNACTSEENTVYYGAVLPEFQDPLVELLADLMRPALRMEDFEMERNVILEEIALYEDQPRFRVYEKLMQEHFGQHPLGNSILGTNDSISSLRRDDMHAYLRRRYCPSNVTAVGTGKIDFERLVETLRRTCSSWEPMPADRATPPARPAMCRRTIIDPKLIRTHVGLMSSAPSNQDDSRYAAELLATIVGDDTGSRLFYALIEPAVADEAAMAYDPLDQAGGFLTFVSCDPQKANEAISVVKSELTRFQREGPSMQELESAKNKIAAGATIKGELPMERLRAVGYEWVYLHRHMTLEEHIDRLFAVSGGQVLDLARQYDLTTATMLVLSPTETA